MSAVNNSTKKPIIGILGGIASGKSTVAAEFAKLGFKLIDADKIAHDFLLTSDIKDEIVTTFGKTILGSDGQIEHCKLADIVFRDGGKLSRLNEILHGPVIGCVEQLIEEYNADFEVKGIVLDMPLLLEIGWAKRCERLIFVDCNRQLRVERAKKSGFIDENQLKIRENFQISLDNKVKISENTIDNNSDFSALVEQVNNIFCDVVGK